MITPIYIILLLIYGSIKEHSGKRIYNYEYVLVIISGFIMGESERKELIEILTPSFLM